MKNLKQIPQLIIKINRIIFSSLIKFKDLFINFLILIKKKLKEIIDKVSQLIKEIYTKVKNWYEINILQKEFESLSIRDFILVEIVLLFLLVLTYISFNLFDNIIDFRFAKAYSFLFVLLIVLVMIFFVFKYLIGFSKYQIIIKNGYIVSTILIVVLFILVVLPLVPVFLIIDSLQYKNKDSKLIFIIKRIVKILIGLFFLFMLLAKNIIEGRDLINSHNGIVALFFTFHIIYFFVPIMLCDIFRIYESKKENLKDLSIGFIIVIIIFRIIMFLLAIDLTKDLSNMLDIISWEFALVGIATLKFDNADDSNVKAM